MAILGMFVYDSVKNKYNVYNAKMKVGIYDVGRVERFQYLRIISTEKHVTESNSILCINNSVQK